MFKELLSKIVRYTEFNFQNANNKDVERSHTTSGAVSAYLDVMRMIGHQVDHGDWDDCGCLRVGFIQINNTYIVRNSEIDYVAVQQLMGANHYE